ncbi:hypothetical protein B2J93_5836 [Marssonina coronariae]|uniref:Uncharacterized protein n=1 Tax=Diplocarpon coronariae TaxID=2795749 RepID=A0A218YTQ4_9HELO|nr:hypothetical protein B2J93_5836 [Marssonina coronariae]
MICLTWPGRGALFLAERGGARKEASGLTRFPTLQAGARCPRESVPGWQDDPLTCPDARPKHTPLIRSSRENGVCSPSATTPTRHLAPRPSNAQATGLLEAKSKPPSRLPRGTDMATNLLYRPMQIRAQMQAPRRPPRPPQKSRCTSHRHRPAAVLLHVAPPASDTGQSPPGAARGRTLPHGRLHSPSPRAARLHPGNDNERKKMMENKNSFPLVWRWDGLVGADATPRVVMARWTDAELSHAYTRLGPREVRPRELDLTVLGGCREADRIHRQCTQALGLEPTEVVPSHPGNTSMKHQQTPINISI